ncbi:fimbrial protein, partial [Klebsiella pneumoniae]|nr:fimbrial protein [Klebsiella pneumoniae]
HGDVLMWLMKTLLTSGCTNQRGAGHKFSVKLNCQKDANAVYVSFDPTTGSTGKGILNVDTSNSDAATGIAVEILNAKDRSPLVFSSETKYHTNMESSIEIPLVAHYKRIGTVKSGTAVMLPTC